MKGLLRGIATLALMLTALPACSVVDEDPPQSLAASGGTSGPRPTPPPTRRFIANCLLTHDDLPSFAGTTLVDREAAPIVRIPPVYPEAARNAKVSGVVVMWALVCPHGKVLEIQVEESVPMLDEAARDAMSQWTFTPAERDGKRVAVWIREPMRFTLN